MNKEIRYCLLSETLLACNELTVYEKIVFARISGFETFFEAPEKTAEFLNISTDKVRKAKQKLEKLGFITCVKSSPKGKAYRIKSLNEIEAFLCKDNKKTNSKPTIEEKSHTEPNKGQLEQNKPVYKNWKKNNKETVSFNPMKLYVREENPYGDAWKEPSEEDRAKIRNIIDNVKNNATWLKSGANS